MSKNKYLVLIFCFSQPRQLLKKTEAPNLSGEKIRGIISLHFRDLGVKNICDVTMTDIDASTLTR